MTFDEIVDRVASRLNLTSPVAIARIGESVNERYGRLTSSVGLSASAHVQVTGVGTPASPYVTFTGVERVDTIYIPNTNPAQHLEEVTFNELTFASFQSSDTPRRFAVSNIAADSVTVCLDVNVVTGIVLIALGDSTVLALSGTDIPAFPAKFHDVLVYGAMASELEHMEKYDMAKRQEDRWEEMLAQLRLYLASNAYLDIHQGKNSPDAFYGLRWSNL